MCPTVTPTDPRYYYLANFERALAWLAQRYADLLTPEETGFFSQFAALPLGARALLVRMLMRRGDVFRSSRLVYDEIDDIAEAISDLARIGWVDTAPRLTLDTLFALMTKPELAALFGAQVTPGARKSIWLEQLTLTYPEPRAYGEWHAEANDCLVHVTIAPLCERLRLMFFGNLYQAWSEFVLADLGIFQYESVTIDAASRAFQRRQDIDTYWLIQEYRTALEIEPDLDLAALLASIDAIESDNPWIESRRAKLLFQVGQHAERLHAWADAQAAYERCVYPGARHRLVRVLERRGDIERAWQLALDALASPQSDEERQRVARMMPRLKRLRVARDGAANGTARDDAVARTARTEVRRTDVVLPRPIDGERVERVALKHLHHDAAPVHYVENTLINALFGLLCWPAIFEPLPGAFFHPFQSGPADLHTPDFHARRLAIFDACFDELDTGTYRQTILDRFEAKYGIQSPFVAWQAVTPELLALALDCIPMPDLKRCFERVLSDIKANRSGLPDLIQFWPSERRYALIEVKGPGDRLQDNQLRWFEFCAAHGIPIEVLHVSWLEEALVQ